ncbi:MAG: aspartate--tRNA ligase, partial [Verrucomicrobiota bacterium]
FYALPQAPQQYKQLLQVAGVEKYFQIARCFRDEDLRADRQPEFTQIDIEASFISQEDLIEMTEGLLARTFKNATGIEIETPFLRLTYEEALNRFGSDKPDMRFGNELVDVGDIFASSEFKVFSGALKNGGVVKAMNAKGFACVTTGQINRLTEVAQEMGAKGLAYIKVEDGTWKSPIVKFFSDEEMAALTERMGIKEGDLVLFGADKWQGVCDVLGRIRLEVAEYQGTLKDSTDHKFLWVTDFPLLGFSEEEGKWNAVHHPFTRPHADDVTLLDSEDNYKKIRAQAYDVVLNGYELGGGSIRIHEGDLQSKMFSVLGVDEEEQREMFGHLLTALSLGAPPHGGIALGFDRIAMLLCGEESIREVMAFPKNNRGQDLMSASPADVDFKQLRELYVKSTAPEKKE